MTFRRSSAAVGLALVLAVGAAEAQQTTPGQPGTRRGVPREELRAQRQPGGGPLFRGITLTAAQQEQVRAINQRYADEGRSLREAARPAMAEVRTARQRGDTVALRQAMVRAAEHRSRVFALQVRRLAEVRRVLTAEQQRQFDANRTELQARMEQRGKEMREGGQRGGRRGMRGGRPGQA